MKLVDFLKSEYNYNPSVKDEMQSYISLWNSLYKGKLKGFHDYYIYNGKKKVKQERYTLGMAKEISEDWADTLWSEKCKISLANDNSQSQFNDLVDELDLYSLINQSIEKSGAYGTNSLVISVYDIIQNEDGMYLDVSNAKTRVDVVDIDWVFPISWSNKGITECAFGSVEYKDGQKYIVLAVHKLNEQGNYVIFNHLFLDNNGDLTELQQDNTLKEFDTQSNIKWYSIFKPNLTNNFVKNSPFGISFYANAIDNLKAVDICFDAVKNEIRDGKKRTFVRADLLNYDSGEGRLTFDPEDTTVYQLPKGATKDDLIQSDSDNLRVSEQADALNKNLSLLGNKVGFGMNYYTYDGEKLQTATAVISSNSKMFRRKKKLEIGYESAIYDLVKGICYASSKFGTYNIDSEKMVIQFDDSIIEDKETESNRALREVSAGLLSKQEYREKIFGETPEIAEQKIRQIEEETPSVDELLDVE